MTMFPLHATLIKRISDRHKPLLPRILVCVCMFWLHSLSRRLNRSSSQLLFSPFSVVASNLFHLVLQSCFRIPCLMCLPMGLDCRRCNRYRRLLPCALFLHLYARFSRVPDTWLYLTYLPMPLMNNLDLKLIPAMANYGQSLFRSVLVHRLPASPDQATQQMGLCVWFCCPISTFINTFCRSSWFWFSMLW